MKKILGIIRNISSSKNSSSFTQNASLKQPDTATSPPYFHNPKSSKKTLTEVADTDGHIASFLTTQDRLNLRLVSRTEQRNIDTCDIRKVAKGILQCKIDAHYPSRISSVAVTPNGEIVTVSWDGTIKIWRQTRKLSEKDLICTIKGCSCANREESAPIYDVAVTPDEKIIIGSWDHTAKICDKKGNIVHTLAGHTGAVLRLAVTPNGNIVTGSSDMTARLWDKEGNFICILEGLKTSALYIAVTPDGKIVIGSADFRIRIWDQEGNLLCTFRKLERAVDGVAVTPDGKIVVVSDHTVALWDQEGNLLRILLKLNYKTQLSKVVVMPDGKIVVVSNARLIILDQTGNLLCTIPELSDVISRVAVTPNGEIVAGTLIGMMEIFKIEERTLGQEL